MVRGRRDYFTNMLSFGGLGDSFEVWSRSVASSVCSPSSAKTLFSYVIPAGKILYLSDIDVSVDDWTDFHVVGYGNDSTAYYTHNWKGWYHSNMGVITPFQHPAGSTFKVDVFNNDAVNNHFFNVSCVGFLETL